MGVVLASVLALGACGSDSSSEGSSATTAAATSAADTSAAAAACADAAALKDSVQALTQIQPLKDGTDALKSAISEVRADLDAALASASAAMQPAVSDLKTAFEQLQTSMTGLTRSNLHERAPVIRDALGQIKTAAVALGTALSQDCPGG